MSDRNGIPLESGPAAIRVEIWVSVAPRCSFEVPAELVSGLDVFQGQDWDSWLENYGPNVGSARILRFEPANESYDEAGAQRVVYTMDLFSEWEMNPEEFEDRMSYDWGEGYWLPEPVPWFIEKREAHCFCASCELIPPIHPPNISMAGACSKTVVNVGDAASLDGWQVVGSATPSTRAETRRIRAALGDVMGWIESAEDDVWLAAVTEPVVISESKFDHEYPFYIAILPDIQPTMKVAVKRLRELGGNVEDLAAHYRREALGGLLCKITEITALLGPPRSHSYAEQVVLWPLVNFGSAWRPACQSDALDGIQRFLDRSHEPLERICLRQQRTQTFEFEMDAATVAGLLQMDNGVSRFVPTADFVLEPMELEQVSPSEVGCPEVAGLRLWRLVPATRSDNRSSVVELNE